MLLLRLLLWCYPTFALLAKLLRLGRRDMIVLRRSSEMAKAIRQAKATPPTSTVARVARPGMTHFAVKVRFPTDTGHEHCWVNELELRESGLSGKLGNHPNSLPDLQLGSAVNVSDDAITDWSYAQHGVYQGHFTTKVLMAHMPKRLRNQVETVYGWAPA